MRNNDYFNRYDGRFNLSDRGDSFNQRNFSSGGMRYGGDSFRNRGEMSRDSYSRPNRNFNNRRADFGERRSSGMRMQEYGQDDRWGRDEYNGRRARSPMRGRKRSMSPNRGMGDNLATAALLSLGLQARQLLQKQAATLAPPPPKMRRLNMGYDRPMQRGRDTVRRGMPRSGAVRSRGGSTRVQKPREVPAWRKSPYHCNYCHVATKSRENHAEHVKTKEHEAAVKEREQRLIDRMYTIHKRAQANTERSRMEGRLLHFCSICSLEYDASIAMHKRSDDHLAMEFLNRHIKCNDCHVTLGNRIGFERHNVTLSHIRNHLYRRMEAFELGEDDEELQCPEEYDENVSVGNLYVNDRRAIYCKVCDQVFLCKDVKVYDHCKSKEHYDNFKEFVVTRKAELEEKAEEKARKAEEAAAAAKESAEGKEKDAAEKEAEKDEEKAEDGEEKMEDKEETADGEEVVDGDEAADGDEAVDGDEAADGGEAVDEEAEDAEEADGDLGEEDGNEEVEMEKEAEEELLAESPKKSPTVTGRTTRKRNTKAK